MLYQVGAFCKNKQVQENTRKNKAEKAFVRNHLDLRLRTRVAGNPEGWFQPTPLPAHFCT